MALSDVRSRTRVFYYLFVNVLRIKIYVLSQKYITCIPPEHKPFWQWIQLDDFTINVVVNVFVHERLKNPPSGVLRNQSNI